MQSQQEVKDLILLDDHTKTLLSALKDQVLLGQTGPPGIVLVIVKLKPL